MNKRLFGYSVPEVEAKLALLGAQNDTLLRRNDYLEEEIKNLSYQLSEARTAQLEEAANQENERIAGLNTELESLRELLRASEERCEDLTQRLKLSEESERQAFAEAAEAKEQALKAAALLRERDNTELEAARSAPVQTVLPEENAIAEYETMTVEKKKKKDKDKKGKKKSSAKSDKKSKQNA